LTVARTARSAVQINPALLGYDRDRWRQKAESGEQDLFEFVFWNGGAGRAHHEDPLVAENVDPVEQPRHRFNSAYSAGRRRREADHRRDSEHGRGEDERPWLKQPEIDVADWGMAVIEVDMRSHSVSASWLGRNSRLAIEPTPC
jgi:hypothetical protein